MKPTGGRGRFSPLFWALLATPALVACGGSGGSGPVAPSAVTPPAAPPTPAPVPVPIATLDTSEYRRSGAATASNVIEAWAAGYSGKSVVIGTVDSGIALGSTEFAGRIHPASRDVTGAGRTVQDEGGHGTSVASVLAAARDASQTVGIAPEATLAVMRADRAGTCAETDGCRYSDSTLAAGIDAATAAGAAVINISLGGSPGSTVLRGAFQRATSAGTVLVISAGNDKSAEIDPFPAAALASAGRSAVIVAGAIGSNRQIADFSNRAGAAQDNFITALGVSVRGFDETGAAFLFSGTSYAAPAVSGAIALLAQAFPNLSAAQLVDLILRSADDAGAPGTDPVYGRGILNIGRAFAPAGGTSLAGTTIPVSLVNNGSLGSAFGGGTSFGSSLGTVPIHDGYGRGYGLAIGETLRPAGAARLGPALQGTSLAEADTAGNFGAFRMQLSLRAERQATATDHADAFRRANPADAALGFAQRGMDARAGLQNPLREARLSLTAGAVQVAAASGRLADAVLPGSGASGLVAPDGLQADADPARNARALLMLETRLGAGRVAVAASDGRMGISPASGRAAGGRQARLTAAVSAPAGPLLLGARVSQVSDEGALLGTSLSGAFGLLGGSSVVAGGSVDAPLGGGIGLRAAASSGWHSPRLADDGLLRGGETLRSVGWSLSATAPGVRAGDRVQFTLAQPLALTGGHFSSANGAVLAVAPDVRERAAELSYRTGPWGLYLFHRENPGHQTRDADAGVALTFSTGF